MEPRWLRGRSAGATAPRRTPAELRAHKGDRPVAVVIPTKECASTIADVVARTVQPLVDQGLVDELVVVDAGSLDGTADAARAAGATVFQQDALLADYGPALGKGDAMWRALHATTGDIVCFLDGDTTDPDRPFAGVARPVDHAISP